MSIKTQYPVFRHGYLFALEEELENSKPPETIKKYFENENGGWDQIIESAKILLEGLIKQGQISRFNGIINTDKDMKPKLCEGLITKCSKTLNFSSTIGSQIIEVEVRLSLTICREPHLSKIWISFIVRDGIGVNGSNPIIESSKIFENISDSMAVIIRNKYQEYRPENIIEIHRLFIKATGNPELLLKEFVNNIENEDGYRIQDQINGNNNEVFQNVKPIISLSFKKEPNNINDYKFFLGADQVEWAVFQTLDQKNKGLFIKRHDVDFEPAKTIFAGSVCGGIEDTLELTRSIIRTLAPFL